MNKVSANIGVNCNFCHRPHSLRRRRLEKRHRRQVEALTPSMILRFASEVILQKFPTKLDLPPSQNRCFSNFLIDFLIHVRIHLLLSTCFSFLIVEVTEQ